tara:strand:- start:2766 stop:3524 length:759 start_codon:yes stop_codon:yes gene_type:complete
MRFDTFDTIDTIASLKGLAKAIVKTPEICPAVALATLAYACKQEGMFCANWLTRRARILAQQPSKSDQPLLEIQRTFLRIAPGHSLQRLLIARVLTNARAQIIVSMPLLAILPSISRRSTARIQHAHYKLALIQLIKRNEPKLLDTLLFEGLDADSEYGLAVPEAMIDLSLVALAIEQGASDKAITALLGGKKSLSFFALQNSNALRYYCDFDFAGNASDLGMKGMFRGQDCGRMALLQFLDENIGLGNMTF